MESPTPTNLVVVHLHAIGRVADPLTTPMPVPQLRRLAAEGTGFSRAFSVSPTSSPSRASMFTGRLPHQHGLMGRYGDGWNLTDPDDHLVAPLRAAGYSTAVVGTAKSASYDRFAVVDGDDPRAGGAGAAALLDGGLREPFFLVVRTSQRATPELAPHPAPCLPVPGHLPDGAEARDDMARTETRVAGFDDGLGALLDALDRNDLAERTLLVVTTEHGLPLPGAKGTLSDHGLGVTLLVRGPGVARGHVAHELVSQLDLYPTIAASLGLRTPPRDGRPLVDLLRGRAGDPRDAVFAQSNHHRAYDPQRAIRTDAWKYVRRFDGADADAAATNADRAASTPRWLAARGPEVPRHALYALANDPDERVDLSGDPAHADVLAHLSGRLQAWMASTDDPLLHGPIPAPAAR